MEHLNVDKAFIIYAMITTAFFIFLSFCSEETQSGEYLARIHDLEQKHDENVDDYNNLVDDYNIIYEQLASYKKKYDFLQKDDPAFLEYYNDLYAENQELEEEVEELKKRIARLESRLARMK